MIGSLHRGWWAQPSPTIGGQNVSMALLVFLSWATTALIDVITVVDRVGVSLRSL